LNWKKQIEQARAKGARTMIAASKMLGKSFSLNPYMTNWIYNAICIPKMLYGCFAWWRVIDKAICIPKT
jgi:hypothetical protein